jgi:hypothetical protein
MTIFVLIHLHAERVVRESSARANSLASSKEAHASPKMVFISFTTGDFVLGGKIV